ncbi:hypothetical protein AOLI_G00056280 [Acnodon oligacanthus]
MEMKMSRVCLVLGLVLLMTVSSDANPLSLSHPDLCCFRFTYFNIPEEEILKIEKLHSNCPKNGYVFTTPQGRICRETF